MESYTYLRNIQDLLSDGKTPYERRFGELFIKDQSFRLVHWLSTTLSLRLTSQESINLERKSYLDCSLDTLCMWWEFGRVLVFTVHSATHLALSTIQFHAHNNNNNNNNNKELAL